MNFRGNKKNSQKKSFYEYDFLLTQLQKLKKSYLTYKHMVILKPSLFLFDSSCWVENHTRMYRSAKIFYSKIIEYNTNN